MGRGANVRPCVRVRPAPVNRTSMKTWGKTIIVTIAVVAVSAAGLTGMLEWRHYQSSLRNAHQRSLGQVRALADSARVFLGAGQHEALRQLFKQVAATEGARGIVLVDRRGNETIVVGDTRHRDLALPPGLTSARDGSWWAVASLEPEGL